MWKYALCLAAAVACHTSAFAQGFDPTLEQRLFDIINEERKKAALEPTDLSTTLLLAARQHSEDMATKNFFSHTDPNGKSLSDRLAAVQINPPLTGENILTTEGVPDPAEAAVKEWMASPIHRKNILNPNFEESAIGAWRDGNKVFLTQVFSGAPVRRE